MAWNTEEDFERDINEYSECLVDQHFEAAPPPTLQEYHKRMQANKSKKSIYDEEPQDEGVDYFLSGRGKLTKNVVLKPGANPSPQEAINNENETKRMLRQVSGIGYSNKYIEHSIKQQTFHKTSPKRKGVKPAESPAPEASSPQRAAPPLTEMLRNSKRNMMKCKETSSAS